MVEHDEPLIRRQLRSPRAAAIAGILFSLLLTTSMILFRNIGTIAPADIDQDWLGEREDMLFATVFWGSGLIFVTLLFVWAATLDTIFGSYAAAANRLTDNEYLHFWRFVYE